MATFLEELNKLKSDNRPLDQIMKNDCEAAIEKLADNHPSVLARQRQKETEQKTAEDLEAAMTAHVRPKMQPGENETQAFCRLVSSGDPALAKLYSQRKAAKALGVKRRVDGGMGVHAGGINKNFSDIHDAQQDQIVKASLRGETISESEAMTRAMTENPDLYSAYRSDRLKSDEYGE